MQNRKFCDDKRVSLFGGMERWNGMVGWNSGMVEYWNDHAHERCQPNYACAPFPCCPRRVAIVYGRSSLLPLLVYLLPTTLSCVIMAYSGKGTAHSPILLDPTAIFTCESSSWTAI